MIASAIENKFERFGAGESMQRRLTQLIGKERNMVYHIAGGNDPLVVLENPKAPIDGVFNQVRPLDESQDGGMRIRASNALSCGRPVDGAHMPTRLERSGPANQPLLDIDSGYGGSLFVSKKFKETIEHFEPDVHQFFPMTIEQEGAILGEHFLFIICNRLDTLHRELTVPPLLTNRIYTLNHDGNDRMVFDLRKIGNCHVWHDKFAIGRFVTDVVFEALGSNKITGLGFTHFEQA